MAWPNSVEAKKDLKRMDILSHMHITADLSKEKVMTVTA